MNTVVFTQSLYAFSVTFKIATTCLISLFAFFQNHCRYVPAQTIAIHWYKTGIYELRDFILSNHAQRALVSE